MTETLTHLLCDRASTQPDQLAYTYLRDGEAEAGSLTYAVLDRRARAVAAELMGRIDKGERAMLLFPTGLDFLVAFFGCLYAGVIAVPAPPPDPARVKRTMPRLEAILSDATVSVVLTTAEVATQIESHASGWDVTWLITDAIDIERGDAWQRPALRADDLAYLQYTSGSTSMPKGVMVSHGNVMIHCGDLARSCGYTAESISAVWMPNYHDYGLVEGLLQPLVVGIPCYILSPASFVQHPIRWLQVVSRYRVTHSQGPSFAYGLCVRRTTPAERAELDLSSWRAAGNAAEPIHPETARAFIEAFAPHGFRPTAMCPAFGLAEATLLASFNNVSDEPVFLTVDAVALADHRVVEVGGLDGRTRTLVSCGTPVRGTRIEIVHPEQRTPCRPGEVGEIWVESRGVARGYWGRPEESERTFRASLVDSGAGRFLRTGDLGAVHRGELVVTGRLKDLLIVRGVNHYPQDIEWSVERSHPAIRTGFCAAFQVEVSGEERLVVVAELGDHTCDTTEVIAAIRQELSESHDLALDAAALLEKGGVLKTSSGKIRRAACAEAYLNGDLPVIDSWVSGHAGATASRSDRTRHATDMAIRAPTSPAVPPDVSAASAHDLTAWLRSYARDRINSRIIDERRCIPPNIILDFGNRGILGMQVADTYGGLGLSNRDAMRVLEQVAAIDLTLGTFVCVNNYLGIRPVQQYATETRRARAPSCARLRA